MNTCFQKTSFTSIPVMGLIHGKTIPIPCPDQTKRSYNSGPCELSAFSSSLLQGKKKIIINLYLSISIYIYICMEICTKFCTYGDFLVFLSKYLFTISVNGMI